jgi:hypothetical protein
MRLSAVVSAGALLLVLGFGGGCGGDSLGRQPVAGSVSVNGSPLENGNVSFHPVDKGIGSGAPVSGGKFSIAQKDGLPPGKYRVTINAPIPGTGGAASPDALPGDPPAPAQELIPPEWNSKSEQFVEVTNKGKNDFSFSIDAKKK